VQQRVGAGARGRHSSARRPAHQSGRTREQSLVFISAGRHGGAVGRRHVVIGVGVEQQVDGPNRTHPVGHAVVGLPDQRPAAAGQAIEQRHLPQWTTAIQAVGVEVRDPVQQLGFVPGSGQRGMVDVPV
jgi:hypothetical protein